MNRQTSCVLLLLFVFIQLNLNNVFASIPPDNVVEGDCYVYADDPYEWGIRLAQSSTLSVLQQFTPLVGDLDNDGMPEIVAVKTMGINGTVTVFKGNNVSISTTLNLHAELNVNTIVPIGLVRVMDEENSADTIGLIIIRTATDIRSYKFTDINTITLFKQQSINNPDIGPVAFADFNNDGKVEVYCGNKIYNAYSLELIAQGAGNSGRSYSHSKNENISFAADVLPTVSGIELVCGSEIYSVDFNASSLVLKKTITPPAGYASDGFTQIADFNNDGDLDVLVKEDESYNYGFYAYNPQTSSILFSKKIKKGQNFSFPQIGDIDGDNKLEIVVLYSDTLLAYRITGSVLDLFWTMKVEDNSGMTGAVLFDFNQDGKKEIIHRDEIFLRVIDGSTNTPIVLLVQNNIKSGTTIENPIVVDCDADGEAEIITIGSSISKADTTESKLRVYKSTNSAWAPARPVWNQYAYNVTNVNKDLTIPSNPFNNASYFSNGKQPFNGFQEQATTLEPTGNPIFQANMRQFVALSPVVCGSYDFLGNILTTTGIYKDTIPTTRGCDSIFTLDLTVYPEYHIEQNIRLHCDEIFSVNGNVYDKSGFYTEYMQTINGCDSIVSTKLIRDYSFCPEIEIPAYFSPNGDGRNDFFEIENLQLFPKATVEIYDRYSTLLVSYSSSDLGWDGFFNGKAVASTDYWYIINIPELGFQTIGHVLLIR